MLLSKQLHAQSANIVVAPTFNTKLLMNVTSANKNKRLAQVTRKDANLISYHDPKMLLGIKIRED